MNGASYENIANHNKQCLPKITFQTHLATSKIKYHYLLQNKPLTSGAHGTVYKAFRRNDIDKTRPFAVKVVPDVISSSLVGYRLSRTFYREYLSLSILNQAKNVITLEEVFVDLEDNIYYVFPFFDLTLAEFVHGTFGRCLWARYCRAQKTEIDDDTNGHLFSNISFEETLAHKAQYDEVSREKRHLIEHIQEVPKITWSRQMLCSILWQLAQGLEQCHRANVIHQDIKPQNILIKHTRPNNFDVVLTDFGIASIIHPVVLPHTPTTIKEPDKTQGEVCTLWYRAPEILLGSTNYSFEIDVWAMACVFWEVISYRPLFAVGSSIELLYEIYKFMGTPTKESWPGVNILPFYNPDCPTYTSETCTFGDRINELLDSVACRNLTLDDKCALKDLLSQMFTINPKKRISAKNITTHYFFTNVDKTPPTSEIPLLPQHHHALNPDFSFLDHLQLELKSYYLSPVIMSNLQTRLTLLLDWTAKTLNRLHPSPFNTNVVEKGQNDHPTCSSRLSFTTQNCAFRIVSLFLVIYPKLRKDARFDWIKNSIIAPFVNVDEATTGKHYYWPLLGLTAIWMSAHKIYFRSLPRLKHYIGYRDEFDGSIEPKTEEGYHWRLQSYISWFNLDIVSDSKMLHSGSTNQRITKFHLYQTEQLILQTIPIEQLLSSKAL